MMQFGLPLLTAKERRETKHNPVIRFKYALFFFFFSFIFFVPIS